MPLWNGSFHSAATIGAVNTRRRVHLACVGHNEASLRPERGHDPPPTFRLYSAVRRAIRIALADLPVRPVTLPDSQLCAKRDCGPAIFFAGRL